MTTAITWGELTDDLAGRPVTFTFPWEQSPTSAVFVRRGYLSAFDEADGCERWTHQINYGGDVGTQETAFRVDAAVELGDAGAPPPPPVIAPGATDPIPPPEPEPTPEPEPDPDLLPATQAASADTTPTETVEPLPVVDAAAGDDGELIDAPAAPASVPATTTTAAPAPTVTDVVVEDTVTTTQATTQATTAATTAAATELAGQLVKPAR